MLVDWKDERGRYFRMSVPDDAKPDQYQYGSPVGPPDLSDLGLPESLMVRLHNQLFDRGLFTARDAVARRSDVIGAWQAALKTDAQAVVDVYGRLEQSIVLSPGEHPAESARRDQLAGTAAIRNNRQRGRN